MNVSKEARGAYIAFSGGVLKSHIDNIEAGKWDETTGLQAFAKFEAEITQRVRDEALEEAAVKAISIGEQYGEDETGWLDCSETIAAAIRQMIGGKA